MTKKNLNWRLKELPDAVDVAELVDKKVITPEEARDLLFSEGEDKTKKNKELEEEVKFLRDLCDKLAAKSDGWTTVVREIKDYTPRYPYWYKSYASLNAPSYQTVGTFSSTAGAIGGTNNIVTAGSVVANAKMLGNIS